MYNFDLALLILFLPLALPFILRIWFHNTVTWQESAINVCVVLFAGLLMFFAGQYAQTADTLILNGEITGKEKNRVSCSHSYSCYCRTVSCGKDCSTTVCQTCYDHPYDFDWDVYSTVGDFSIERVDRQGVKEPPRWTIVQKGEPASRQQIYTNWIKGSPDSIFSLRETLLQKYPHQPYPTVYDYYRINRVINDGAVSNDFSDSLNKQLNLTLRSLGPSKQINVVFLFTKNINQDYAEAVRQDWLGGKKNDAVVVWSVTDNKTNWIEVFSWSKKSMFDVVLTDNLMQVGLDPKEITKKFSESTRHFQRRPMEEFEYLKHSISPPKWALVGTFILSTLLSIGVFIIMHREEIAGVRHRLYRPYRLNRS